MAYSAIVKPSDYFNTKLYTGNGSTQSITGVGFQPDMVWTKSRGNDNNHNIYDAVRGATKRVFTNSNSAESTVSTTLTSFDSDGFSLGSQDNVNANGITMASWNWKGNGAGSANTDGTLNSTVSVNTTAGFSVVKYTGNGNNTTVGHGLGTAPGMVIIKRLNSTGAWPVWHSKPASINEIVELNSTGAQQSGSSYFNNSATTSSVFPLGTSGDVNASGGTYIAYCFAEKKGYSRISFYTGDGNANGPFIYTGFKPAFFITKRTDAGAGWQMYDSKRDVDNPADHRLQAQSSAVELVGDANTDIDFLSNGFNLRNGDSDSNASGGTYIYIAFAEEPLVANSGTDGVPATAR